MDDLEAVHEVLSRAFGGNTTLNERREWLTWQVMNYTALARLYQPPYGDRAVVDKASGRLIGSVGVVQSFAPFEKLPYFRERLKVQPSSHSIPEMGLFWAIHPDQQRRGYAVEAARALIDFLFTKWGVARLVATTEYDNAPSIGVMEKLGMSVERNPDSEPAWFQVVGVLEQ
jgi:RimJ/RimL family protein N-acetyltransferase